MLSADPSAPDMGPNEPNLRFITIDDMNVDEGVALNLMGTHYLDYATSTTLFESPFVMHHDVLANATAAYLDEIFPPKTAGRKAAPKQCSRPLM